YCERPEDWSFSSYNHKAARKVPPNFDVLDHPEEDDVLDDNVTPLNQLALLNGPSDRLHS
ncbi:hypothetical protein LCGC14_2340030, partial [marine sediment metagenome]